MKGVLVIAHGSRNQETKKTMEQVLELTQKQLPDTVIRVSYMEFCKPNIEEGLDLLAAEDVDEACIIPYFLFSGIHILEDIPGEIAAYQEKHPEMKISFGRTLGADERLAAVLTDRIREAL